MLLLLVIASLCASCLADSAAERYSFSPPVGGGSGPSFSIEGQKRITAVRVWENSNSYITGIQLRFGYIWSTLVGRKSGAMLDMELFENEYITQVSGKYQPNTYIYQIYFGTSRGRFLVAGQSSSISFNMYPRHPDAGLKMLSGRSNGSGITSLGAHWGLVNTDQGNNTYSNNTTSA